MVEAANTSIGVRWAAAHNVKEAQSACLMQRVARAPLGSGFHWRHGGSSFDQGPLHRLRLYCRVSTRD